MIGVVAAIGVFGYSCTPAVTVTSSPGSTTVSVSKAYFDQFSEADQASKKTIAAMIISIGKERKLSDRSITIAIATAIQESNLTNLPFLGAKNDHKSLGIFQQQPSDQWGTVEQIQDPTHAINAFYDALVKIPDRDSRPMMDVAIQVQVPSLSAYKSRWAWDAIAAEIVAQNADSSSQSCATRNVSGAWQVPLNKGTYVVSSGFGMRFHPILHVWKLHDGVDLAAPQGTPVYAASAGVIASAGVTGGYGNYISITHEGGILTGYGHLSGFATGISKGVQVTAGQLIGYVGSTGESTGDHLHFLLHVDGKPVDPVGFMSSVGVSIHDNARG
jgi:murein DD-endopeptidase MepM/ murein hydrolase activator NlpD